MHQPHDCDNIYVVALVTVYSALKTSPFNVQDNSNVSLESIQIYIETPKNTPLSQWSPSKDQTIGQRRCVGHTQVQILLRRLGFQKFPKTEEIQKATGFPLFLHFSRRVQYFDLLLHVL